MASDEVVARRASLGHGFVWAFAINLAVAACTIPIASHWNARGGEEWSVGLVVGSAVLTGLLGTVGLFNKRKRGWGWAVLVGAVLAPLTVGVVFVWYLAVLNGS
jgi:hypothetical protein